MLKDFTKIPFDIIIQAGQSNSEGYGFGDTEKPYENDSRIWYLNSDFTISIAAERVVNNGVCSNFSLSFAREYVAAGKLAEGRALLIIRSAVGGTGFADNRWNPTDDLFLNMMEMVHTAIELNSENKLVALLWHQGETETFFDPACEKHYNQLSRLIYLVRNEFSVPELPFIAGDFVPQWVEENSEKCAPIVEAMRLVCRDISNARFVESDGLLSNAQEVPVHPMGPCWDHDSIHFSRNSLYKLGERYFEKFVEIVG